MPKQNNPAKYLLGITWASWDKIFSPSETLPKQNNPVKYLLGITLASWVKNYIPSENPAASKNNLWLWDVTITKETNWQKVPSPSTT